MIIKTLPSFVKDARHSPKDVISRLDLVISQMAVAKKLDEIPNVKKLSGFKNAYRIRVGDYRIGLFLEDQVVTLVRMLGRKDIYKHFP